MANKKSVVAIAKEPSVQESVTKVFDLMGGVTKLIEKGSTVVLKPNAGHVADPHSAVVTSPEVIQAVVREVKKAEPGRIIIAEAAAIGCDTMECFDACGVTAIAEEEGVELIDIKREKDLITVPIRGYRSNINKVKLPRWLIEAEHIINLPILKAHASMMFSCALKNIKGVVQDKVHLDMHQQNLTMAMMDVWYAVRADINIVDAIYAGGGYSPHEPVPEYIGCILGSKDPVAVDKICCYLAGLDPNIVSYFTVAEEAGFGCFQDEDITVVGERWQDHKVDLWIPYLAGLDSWPEYKIYYKNACSSCQALLALNMETMKANGMFDKNTDMTIVVGRKTPEEFEAIKATTTPDKLVLHGNCLRRYMKDGIFVEGCPPAEGGLKNAIAIKKTLTEQTTTKEDIEKIIALKEADKPLWHDYVMKEAEKYKARKAAEAAAKEQA